MMQVFSTDFCQNSFKTLIKTLDSFSKISGLNLNKDKCTILRIGPIRHTNAKLNNDSNFIWTSNEAKTLGIAFSNDIAMMTEINLKPLINSMKHSLCSWKKMEFIANR